MALPIGALRGRQLSQLGCSCSSTVVQPISSWPSRRPAHSATPRQQHPCQPASRPLPSHVPRALFDPPPFSPDKLSVSYRVGGGWSSAPQPGTTAGEPHVSPRRCYTLTHNDITGALQLTVDTDFNYRQISGFYTRLLRDEVTAEWRFDAPTPCLHIYCYVSGPERWLAPAQLRNYIFRREIPLVLDTFLYADRHLLQQQPELASAEVYVHFNSSDEALNRVELWGILNERSTWQVVPTSVLKRMVWALTGQQFQQQQEALENQVQQQRQRQRQRRRQRELRAAAAAAAVQVGASPPAPGQASQERSQGVGAPSSHAAVSRHVVSPEGKPQHTPQQQQQQHQQRARQGSSAAAYSGASSNGSGSLRDKGSQRRGGEVASSQLASDGQQGEGHSSNGVSHSSVNGSSRTLQGQGSTSSSSRGVSSSSSSSSSSSRSEGDARADSLVGSLSRHRSVGFVAMHKSELQQAPVPVSWQPGTGIAPAPSAVASAREGMAGSSVSD